MVDLPFTLFLTSLLGAILAGYACSMVGTFVVRLNLASIGFGMAHAAFAGAAFAIWMDIDPMVGAVLFSITMAMLLGPISEKAKLKTEVVTGVAFSLSIALAFIFLNLTPGNAASGTALRILWGSIFSVDWYDVIYLGMLAACITVFVAAFYKEIVALMFNRKLAEAVGIHTRYFYYAILILTGLSVSLSLKLVGGLLVYALIINPTSSAYQFFYDFKKIVIFAPVFGIASCLAGFYFSLVMDFPIGSSIVIICAIMFAVSVAFSPKRRRG